MRTQVLLLIFSMFVLVVGCGGSSSSAPPSGAVTSDSTTSGYTGTATTPPPPAGLPTVVTPASENITGTYTLSSAKGLYVCKNGVLSFDMATSITGTLIIGTNAWDETYEAVWDESFTLTDETMFSKQGIYDIEYANALEGLIGVVYQDGADPYSFTIDGYTLNLLGTPESRWMKISDDTTPAASYEPSKASD
jgi:hypothetical protein